MTPSSQGLESPVNPARFILLFDPNIPVDEMADLVSKVYESDLQEHVIAELNFARFVQRIMSDLLADASELEAKLQEYRSQLQ